MWPAQFPNDPQPQFRLTRLIAVNILMLGASNIWWVPLSNWAGRRPVLIIATLMMTVCSVWGATATSYNSLLAARIFQGAGGGASETVAPALVGDMFFAHERGRAMACTPFSSPPAQRLVPSSPELSDEKRKGQAIHEESHELVEPVSLVASLGFRRPTGSLVDHFTRPWRALRLPGTWVVTLHYAGLVGGIVTISTVGAHQMAMPPYSWGANAGLVNLGGLVGVVLGYIYTYVLSDSRFKKKAKVRGHGMSEAEDRLPLLCFPLALSTCGFFVFGFCAQYPGGSRWVGLQVGFAMLSFGLMQVPSIGFNYLIDAYTVAASDCFTVATIIRSCIAFAWTFFVSDWEHHSGPAEPFGIFGMLMGLFSLTTIPLWLYGKRLRIVIAPMIQRWM
ncbi:putative MFS-type transporter like protein [Verticillium longisporum]|nr:putative MFS-type transporter like protein [Verticillium longisporum]